MLKVLFVCTGNTCRSSMAAALFKKLAQEKGKDIEIDSCGIAAVDGMPASSEAIQVLKERGIDLSGHRAKKLRENLLNSDLILTMTKSQRDYILNNFPKLKGRVFVLTEFINEGEFEDIEDPYGMGIETYKKVADELWNNLQKLIERIEQKTIK
ncbi:low molecular weight protein arginine phosphatase [Thermovenabulum gondwanense]|uniref:Protein-arginine-phosphatase n=1 Tax=Thermovenabulum gondwanense TaxID=520767 RepID=A0A162MDZ1_9FIRM|nr:low molecular weight protein arginine phosphatase [Thermovenabulum gondwanense]KYO65405.1 Protein-arginine-phosphatase [Thermovenabulum gondwanense]